MATSLSTHKFDKNGNDNYLETFRLVWLDANPAENRSTEQKLRSIINHLKKMKDVTLCRSFIEQLSINDRLVMIVSGRLGREIVPNIHNLRQVISIYVYCMDKENNEIWARKYKKVKAVITELDELIACIKADHKIQKVIEEPFAINIFSTSTGAGNSTTGVNGKFVFSQVLIDCLLRIKSDEVDQQEWIEYCKQQYAGNREELDNIDEFQQNYSFNRALWWYTKESFFYKTLNTALRKQTVHLMYLFRTYIYHIYQQLKKAQVKCSICIYRAQMISKDELEILKKCLGQLISINSFFSTSLNKKQALSFLHASDVTDNLVPVLFIVDADPEKAISKPFADVRPYSDYPDESEILFMIGSIFRLESFTPSNYDEVLTIQMSLCNDDDHTLKQVLTDMKEQYGDEETNLRTLARLLSEMSEFDLAEEYFMRLLRQLPANDPLEVELYQDLAKITSQNQKFDQSMKWRQKSLAIREQLKSSVTWAPTKLNKSIGSTTCSTAVTTTTSMNKNFHIILNIPANAKWQQKGVTVAGGNRYGHGTNQLYNPFGLFVDDDQTFMIADYGNDRIIKWKKDDKSGQVIAGGNGRGNRLNQLNYPTDMLIDKETDSLIIADWGNNRVVRWSLRHGTKQGEVVIDKIKCWGLAIDEQRYLYVSDYEKNEVRRYGLGDRNGILVAGGNGQGNGLNQFSWPRYLFIDRQQNVYVTDFDNHRIMKWNKGAKEGVIVAGGKGSGNDRTQLLYPNGIFVDALNTLYVADSSNHRIMRWAQGDKKGTVIVGGNEPGEEANKLNYPGALFFDSHSNLYVVDRNNHRLQQFSLK